MIESPDGRLRVENVCVGSRSDRFDDDEDWEIRVVDQETGQVLAKSFYRDNYSIMMGSRDSGGPAAIEISPDAKELWLNEKAGTRRTIPIEAPDPTLRELWLPGAQSPIKWDEVERVSDGEWTEIRYRVPGNALLAQVHERTGEGDPAPIDRVLLSPLRKVLVILRSDGSTGPSFTTRHLLCTRETTGSREVRRDGSRASSSMVLCDGATPTSGACFSFGG